MSEPILDRIELLKGMTDLAELVHAFYVALIEQGFTALEALTLTSQWMSTALNGGAA